jgi:hypothetical protein
MKFKLFLTGLIACMLACTSVQAQFFYPKKCISPDSIFTELLPGSVNIWASGGLRRGREDGHRQNNWFSSVTLNYVPIRSLETGIRINKPIPGNEPYSYQHSFDYVPYLRYSLLTNGCFKYALWGDVSYHMERKRTKNSVIDRMNAAGIGFGIYKTIGRFLWLETHSEFLPTEKITRQELKLVWKMVHANIGKRKEARRVNLNVPIPIF